MNAQELIETLEWRYATKVFNPDRRIPAEDWEALLESLHLSPSSLGLQMWKFLDVRDPAVRSRLREVSWGQPQVTDASHLVVFCARRDFKPEDVQRAFALRPATIIASTFVTFSVPIFSTSDCAMETIDSASSTASAMTGDAPIARQAFAQSLTVT